MSGSLGTEAGSVLGVPCSVGLVGTSLFTSSLDLGLGAPAGAECKMLYIFAFCYYIIILAYFIINI